MHHVVLITVEDTLFHDPLVMLLTVVVMMSGSVVLLTVVVMMRGSMVLIALVTLRAHITSITGVVLP